MLAVPLRRTFVLALLLAGCPEDQLPTWGPAFDAEPVGWLLSVWGPSGDELFAVGGRPDPSDVGAAGTGVVMRKRGADWSELDLGIEAPLLNWVHGFGPDDVFVVGNGGFVAHWDGTVWARQETPTTEQLWGIWGASPDDLWSVGGSGREGAEATVLHYDGTAWARVELPMLSRARVFAFFKVWGSGPRDVIVVGQRGAVLRFDGDTWTEQQVGTGDDLISVWGTGPDRVAVAGGRGNATVVTWDGTAWHSESLSPLPGLNGVWMRSPDTFHVVGSEGTIAVVDFDSRTYIDASQPTRLALHAIFGDSAGRLTTVGGNFAMPMGPYAGIAYTRELANEE